MRPVTVGNAQGFWGDSVDAPRRLVEQKPDLDYLTLDYLSEVSLSIMAIQQEKDPTAGYARDFLDVIQSLTPLWKQGSKVKLISNAGGLQPLQCALACQAILKKENCAHLKIGVVTGDDVLSLLLQNPELYANLESGESLVTYKDRLVTANAYLGARPIADALKKGADIVITGRVADPSLTVGPCLAYYQWKDHEWEKIAGATIAGHLIECGTQVTGGISTHWSDLPNLSTMGYPFAEVNADGSCVITKPDGTGGEVSERTVKEQLLYEIGDPDNYLSPDATVSFLSLEVSADGPNRIRVAGAKGKAAPQTYKVSATYRDGFRAEAYLATFGEDADKKARRSGEIILERLEKAGYPLEQSLIECLGAGDLVPGVLRQSTRECLLRVCVADSKKETLERFAKEIAPLVTSGPQGTSGYTSGRPHIRPIFGYWPCLISRHSVAPKVEIL